MNHIRIIGGLWRGRKIHFRPTLQLRPTLDAARETLFNWLMFDIEDAICLDAFAGSGALGLEALSRGAGFVVFIERERDNVLELKKHVKLLDIRERTQIIHDSALHLLEKPAKEAFDFIFLDPPFGKDLLKQSLKAIRENNHLTTGGMIYFEAEKAIKLADFISNDWEVHRHKVMGEVQFGLLKIVSPAEI
jgi:16S rRNA (guanine966-N2)-methyltransferase